MRAALTTKPLLAGDHDPPASRAALTAQQPPAARSALVEQQADSPLNELVAAAATGSTITVPAGTYHGLLLIDKPLTLIAGGDVTIDAGGAGDAVRIVAPDVTFRGFHVCGTGVSLDEQNTGISALAPRGVIEHNVLDDVLLGITLNSAPGTIVRDNRIAGKPLALPRRGDGIRLWNSPGAIIERNLVDGVRDLVVWYSTGVRLRDNVVSNSRYGMHFMYASDSVMERNQLRDNSVGAFLMYTRDITLRQNVLELNRGPSGYGVGLKDVDGFTMEENYVVLNRVGMYIDNSPSRADIDHEIHRNVIAFNDVALSLLPAVQHNRFRENNFIDNVEQISICGGGQLRSNEFSYGGRGNFWSDYVGYDANGDGVGDVPYRAMSLFENLMDRDPQMRLFLYSPAQQAIELAAKAFPIMQPEPKITDAAPLTRPIGLAFAPAQAGSLGGANWWPAAVLGVAALLGAAFRRFGRSRVRSEDRRIGPPCPTATAARRDGARDRRECADSILTTRNLRKRFGRHVAVDGLNLDVCGGDAVALWGGNGAGKTTIIKCLLGLHRWQGEIRIGGFDARRHGKSARRLVGYVSQELAFHDDLSARETARFYAQLKHVAVSRADEVLRQVGLAEHARKRVAALSGGMKQRLALAVALLADPPLLLLDEPTSNLDSAARRSFLDLLRDLKRTGKTIVFTTHRPEEVSFLADRVVLLERGRAIGHGDSAVLATATGARMVVRIQLARELHEQAVVLLTSDGFDASRNHSAVLVRVPHDRKAAPIAALTKAGIAVSDFEIESEGDHDR
ncbi:MAG: nitrous oxide reductase family maturation protein NosD [Phycisphaerae bacterium]